VNYVSVVPVAETVLAHAILHLLANSTVIGKVIAGDGPAREVWCHASDVMGGHMSRGVTCSRPGVITCCRQARDHGKGDAGDAECSRSDER